MKYFFAFIITVLSACSSHHNTDNKTAKPNVLFIAIDDLRPELGCYGASQVLSPNIDKLASEGIVFKRAYCNVPVCGASRASLLTGILPTKTRFVNYKVKAEEDVPTAKTLSGVFKDAGYTCISNGKIFHYNKDAMEQSWSEKPWMPNVSHQVSFDPESKKVITKNGNGCIYESPDVPDSGYPDHMIAQQTIKDLRRFKESGEPFFLACGFFRPHMPFYAPKKYWDLYDRDSIELATNRYRPANAPKVLRGSGEFKTYDLGAYKPGTIEFHKMMRHGYLACASFADKLVGDVLSELEKLGLAENTIVVLWGDHGWHLGEHEFWGKHNTMHNALQVPLIVKTPAQTSGKQTHALVESVDIYPTLCELAGVSIPESVMGKSFIKLLDKPDQEFRETVYARFKAADAIVTNGFNYSLYDNGEEMLYNLKADPEENNNVVKDEQYSEIVKKMRNYLREKQEIASQYK